MTYLKLTGAKLRNSPVSDLKLAANDSRLAQDQSADAADRVSLLEWPALDIVKSLCVAIILFVHAHFLLITSGYALSAPKSFLALATDQLMILGVLVTATPITAGCVMRMAFARNRINPGLVRPAGVIGKTLLTGAAVAGLGFTMNALTWGAHYTFSWNMLQMVSAAYCLTAIVFLRFGHYGVMLLAAALIGLAQPLSLLLEPYRDAYWAGVLVGNDSKFIFWPIFPWAALPASGFLLTHYYLYSHNGARFKHLLLILGAVLVAVALARGELTPVLNADYVWTQLLQQPPLWQVLGSLGVFALLLVVSDVLAGRVTLSRYGVVNSYSKGILWIYVAQMIVSYHLARSLKHWLPIRDSVERFDSLADIAYYAALPVFMLLFGWGLGALLIRFVSDKEYRIYLRKVA